MRRDRTDRLPEALRTLGSVAAGLLGFCLLALAFRLELPVPTPAAVGGSLAAVLGAGLALRLRGSANEAEPWPSCGALSTLTAAGTLMGLVAAYHLAAYARLPADILSFSESGFVNDILKFRLGLPIYTPPTDNNSSPYTPGAPILTYLISRALGDGDSIPLFRVIQLSYVGLAAVVATGACHLLARRLLSPAEYRQPARWIPVWFPFLFLAALDPRFNPYTHSLHNDGLALLVSVSAFWLIARHSISPRPWLLWVMAVLPALGFLVKQNQLMWGAVFAVYLLMAGQVARRTVGLFLLSSLAAAAAVVGISYALWAEPFVYWVFAALGQKQVALARSVLHLFWAGPYVVMALFGGWALVLRNPARTSLALWLSWLLPFLASVYTSGLVWVTNHLGPGVVIATCWALVALARAWPSPDPACPRWQFRVKEATVVSAMVLLAGSLGYVREPANPVPPDFFRYAGDIEREFLGVSPDRVLLDYGSWIYLRENVLMRDRAVAVAIHVGKNQPRISHAMLSETIRRIEAKTYDKILARQLDTGQTAYDFQNRGSGVKAAMLAHYREIRRIPEVQGIREWWPKHLVSEILVLVPDR